MSVPLGVRYVRGMEGTENLLLRRAAIVARIRAIEELPRLAGIAGSFPGDKDALITAVSEAFSVEEWEAAVMLSTPIAMARPQVESQLREELADVDRLLES